MDPLNVTVISCLYGQTHNRFVADWLEAIGNLKPAPGGVILATDRCPFIPTIHVITRRNHGWRYEQPFYLNVALEQVETEWVWIVDIDDLAFPDALADIETARADVVQTGFLSSEGEVHLPKRYGPTNQYVAGSLVRTAAIRAIGGFRDVEHQDSDLWERLIEAGFRFQSADRPRFHYRRHPLARTVREAVAA